LHGPTTTKISTLSLHDALPILPQHLQQFAKLYEAQGKDEAAEGLYRRALALCEESQGPHSLYTALAAEALATFCRARRRYTEAEDRKSTRLNSSHLVISYAVFC